MFTNLFKGILATMAARFLDNYRHLSIQLLKIEMAKACLHGVRMARLSALGLLMMGLVVGLICVGFILFHVALFVLLPWGLEAKAVLGLLLGLGYMVGGGLWIRAAMDERLWMEKSGAMRMMEDALRHIGNE